MNDRLKTIVDLEKYPIHELNSSIIKNLVKKCKEELNQYSCSTIPNFILPKSLKVMNSELEKQIDKVYMSKESINAYLYAKDDPLLPKDHPLYSPKSKEQCLFKENKQSRQFGQGAKEKISQKNLENKID